MDNLNNKIKELIISYLSIPEDFNNKIDNTIAQLPRYKEKKKSTFKQLIVKIITFIIASISVTSFAVYINNHYIGNGKTTLHVNEGLDSNTFDSLNMIPYENIDGLLYKMVNTKDEYLIAKSIFKDVPNIDFEKEFLIVLDFNRGSVNGLEVLEIDANTDTLNLTLGNNELNNDSGKTLCIKISNQLYRDNLMIKLVPGSNSIEKYGFTPMKDIKKDYINEKAFQENCLVMDGYNGIIYNTESDFLRFVDNCEKNINGAYRIVKGVSSPELINEYEFEVQDIIFENGRFYRFLALYKKNDTDKVYDFETFQNDGIEIFINPYDNQGKTQYCLRKEDGTFYRIIIFFH